MEKCKICGIKTELMFKLGSEDIPICEKCSTDIKKSDGKVLPSTQQKDLPPLSDFNKKLKRVLDFNPKKK